MKITIEDEIDGSPVSPAKVPEFPPISVGGESD